MSSLLRSCSSSNRPVESNRRRDRTVCVVLACLTPLAPAGVRHSPDFIALRLEVPASLPAQVDAIIIAASMPSWLSWASSLLGLSFDVSLATSILRNESGSISSSVHIRVMPSSFRVERRSDCARCWCRSEESKAFRSFLNEATYSGATL